MEINCAICPESMRSYPLTFYLFVLYDVLRVVERREETSSYFASDSKKANWQFADK